MTVALQVGLAVHSVCYTVFLVYIPVLLSYDIYIYVYIVMLFRSQADLNMYWNKRGCNICIYTV
jgi:hypothetical protein